MVRGKRVAGGGGGGRKAAENSEADKHNPTELHWTDPMEAALLNAFVEQYDRGKRADLGWKGEAWGPIIEAVQAAYGGPLAVTKVQCQSKEAIYKNHFKDHTYIARSSGFTWNEELGAFEAAPEAWDELVKVYSPMMSSSI
jgi:Myb/SANT-like DNA-binding domain